MWSIKRIEINGGFLPGVTLNLPEGLTCIIGPRGSGKSTLAELIRFAICGAGGGPRSRQEMIQTNLGASGLVTVLTRSSETSGYTVRRGLRQPATLTTLDGKTIASVDLDRGTFLPLDVYSGPEIEAIADESLGEKRRSLLDELRQDELRRIQTSIADSRRKLEGNADEVSALQRSLADQTEEIEEIGDIRAKLLTMAPLVSGTVSSQLTRVNQQTQRNRSELHNIQRADDFLANHYSAVEAVIKEVSNETLFDLADPESINHQLLQAHSQALKQNIHAVYLALAETLTKLTSMREEIAAARSAVAVPHQKQAEELFVLQKMNEQLSEAVRERAEAEHKLQRLEELQKRQAQHELDIDRLLKVRQSLKADFLLERDKISAIRTDVAAWLQKEAGDHVRVRIIRNADDLTYRNLLVEGLKGARVRNHDDIMRELLTIRPEDVGQMIREGDWESLENLGHFGTERSHRIIDAFRENLNPYALEIVDIDDQVKIELNIATGGEALFKDASDLSRGQKCTALLPILLARRDSPLVIDQPEDNLDNHFIYETVVSSIKRLRKRRQMIFITHNANIPVLAEADMVVVMNSDGKSGFVEKVGTVDECKEQIIDLLEGGREAFELRRKRYV